MLATLSGGRSSDDASHLVVWDELTARQVFRSTTARSGQAAVGWPFPGVTGPLRHHLNS